MSTISTSITVDDALIVPLDETTTGQSHPNLRGGSLPPTITPTVSKQPTPGLRGFKGEPKSRSWAFFGKDANVASIAEKVCRIIQGLFMLSSNYRAKMPHVDTAKEHLGTARDALFSHAIFNTAYRMGTEGFSFLDPLHGVDHTLSSSTVALENTVAVTGNTIDLLTPFYLGASVLGFGAAAPIGTALGVIWAAHTTLDVARIGKMLYYSQDVYSKDGTLVHQFKDKDGNLLKDKHTEELKSAFIDLVTSYYCGGILLNLPLNKIIAPASMVVSGTYGLVKTFN